MERDNSRLARQIAQAAIAFEQQRTGSVQPRSVSVVMSDNTLVITMDDALSPAERALAKTPEGAAQIQEYYRQVFATSSGSLREEIQRITGMDVRGAIAEIEPATGAVVHAFTSGATVQVFRLAGNLPTEAWREH